MTAPRLARALLGLWFGIAVATTVFATRGDDYLDVGFTWALGVFAGVGALLAARRPRNPMGWMLEATAIAFGLTGALEAYTANSDAPAVVAMWLDDWVYVIWIALVCVLIPLLFPDGRLPSPRWRPVAWLGTAAFGLILLGRAFGDRTLDTSAARTVANPYALPGVAGEVAAFVASLEGIIFTTAALGALAGLVVRMRHSRGVERQQLKWFAFVGALMLGALLVASVSLIDPERLGDNIGVAGWGSFVVLTTFGLPLAIGTAVLRHRLYDIDVVINRTLVYGTLTAALGGVYLVLVVLIGLAVGRSNLAIAASTLAVAALFRPARAQIQAAVDRRFYRARYDAARTLEAFSARLREEVDVEAVGTDLRGAVLTTMQPTHVSLWLRNRS